MLLEALELPVRRRLAHYKDARHHASSGMKKTCVKQAASARQSSVKMTSSEVIKTSEKQEASIRQ